MAEKKKKKPSTKDILTESNGKSRSKKTHLTSAQEAGEKFTKVADETFDKLKTKFEPKKVDDWQKKWLATPEARKKYKDISDAPEVVGEELTAMVNDIIDFAQGQDGGKSSLFKKIKQKTSVFFKNPIGFLQKKASQSKEMAEKTAGKAKKASSATKKESKKADAVTKKKAKKATKKTKK